MQQLQPTIVKGHSVDRVIANTILRFGNPPVDCPDALRETVATEIAAVTNASVPFVPRESQELVELRRDGIIRFPKTLLTAQQTKEVRGFLRSCPVYNAHVPGQSDGQPRYLSRWPWPTGLPRVTRFLWPRGYERRYPFGSYMLGDVIRAPHLMELFLRDDILQLAGSYLGCAPTLFSVHAWWSFPRWGVRLTHKWHRDADDYKFLALFVYLTDVDMRGGQHVFVKHSHRETTLRKSLADHALPDDFPFGNYECHPSEHRIYDLNSVVCTGPEGTAFLGDTYGLHKAVPPANNRLVVWARYGLHAGPSYAFDRTKPVPRSLLGGRITFTPELDYVTRLILE